MTPRWPSGGRYLLFATAASSLRERIAHLGQRLVAGKAIRLDRSGAVLLVGGEDGVVPFFIAQHLGDVFAPAGVARHGGVELQLVGHEKAVASHHGFALGVELGRVHFSKQVGAVGQVLAFLGRAQRRRVGVVVAHRLGSRKVDRVVLREAALVGLGKRHAGFRQVRQER